jgi:hypothetical protein
MIQALSVVLGSIVVGAVGDGLNDKGKVLLGHAFKAAEVGILLMSPFIINSTDWLAYGAGYILIRAAIFDPIYNISRGNKLSYLGNSSLYNRILKKFKAPSHGYWFMRFIFAVAGVGTLIKFL